jgi:hypothetical protein
MPETNIRDDLALSTVAGEVVLMTAITGEVPPALNTLQSVILAVAGIVWEPAVELVECQAVVVVPLREIELRVCRSVDSCGSEVYHVVSL